MEKEMKKKKLKTKWLVLMLSALVVLFAASGLVLHLVLSGEEEPVVQNEEPEDEEQEEVVQTPGHVDITWYDDKETDFTITTIQQLNGLSLLAMTYDFEGKNIKLGADITMNEGNAAEWNKKEPDYFYTPIGKMEKPFKGNFDGQGHTISGLYTLREHTVALFAFTQGSTIKNIRLVNSYFETTGLPVATKDLIGFTASIVGRSVGGTIENCYSDAHLVSVGMYNGGICAEVLNQTGNVIRNCWFDGSMNLSIQEGQKNWHVAGGILGAVSEDVTIEHCLNTADITGTGCMVGGLIGWTAPGQTTVLRDCLNVGKVTAASEKEWFQSSTVSYARSQSIVKMEDVYTITESNIYSNVRSDRAIVEGAVSVFPLAKIKGIDAYKRTGLDFDNYWVAVKDETPELQMFSQGTQLATKGVAKAADYIDVSWYKEGKKTFTLKTIQQLNGLAYLTKSNNFEGVTIKLGADITMNKGNAADWAKKAPDAVWTPIGEISAQFEGTFDGQGHTISGLYAKSEQQVGLFGWVGKKATLKNLKITNSYFRADGRVVASDNNKIYALVGSLAGVVSGVIEDIYSDAIVEGVGSFGGGLIGRITNYEAAMKNCQFSGSVKMYNATEGSANKAEYIGGLVGSIDAKTAVESCNFTGSIWSESGNMMGGLAGRVLGAAVTLRGCLSTGTVQKDGPVVYMTSMGVGYINTTGSLDVKDTYILYTGTTGAQYRKEEKTKFTGYFTQKNAREDYVGLGTKATGLLGYEEWILTADLPELRAFSTAKSIVDVSWYDEEKDTYKLDSIQDFYGFMLLGQNNTFEGKEILLTTDIEFNEGNATEWKEEAPKNQWQTIGTISSQFAGTFDGQGHTISGIYAKGEQQVGLFGWTAKGSAVKNFKLVNSYFEASGRVVASDNNKIYSLVGSVSGVASGTIEGIYSDAIVEGVGSFGGGLIGRITNYEATMKNCQFAGSVKMYDATAGSANKAEYIGGLVGSTDAKTTMESCNFTGSIWSESGNMMGGFAGRALGAELTLNGCLSTGTVQKDGTVVYMTSLGVGYINTTGKLNVAHTYILNTGTTSAHYRKETATVLNGGFVCYNAVTDYQGLTTKATGLFQYSEWILTEKLPELATFTEAESIVDFGWYDADKTEYKLKDIKEIYGFAILSQHNDFAGKEILLKDDITLNEGDASQWKGQSLENVWLSIGSSSCPFAGTFDGQSHTISGVCINGAANVGLFGMIEGGTVKNLKLANSSFTGSAPVGALAGRADNAVFENIDVTAYVYASGGHVGGFIGQHLAGTLAMTDCHMLGGTVTSDSTIAGGVIGTNGGTTAKLTNCSNSASVQAAGTSDADNESSQAGGFVGRAQDANATLEFVKCTNNGVIYGTKANVGGFVGLAKGSGNITIKGSTNKGAVSVGISNTGGFVGKFDNAGKTVTIIDSNNEGTVSSPVSVAGGFIGFLWGITDIDNCANKAAIIANSVSAGGFVAHNPTGSITIKNSTNEHGITTAAQYTGGFVGYAQQNVTLQKCTNKGTIISTKDNVGGFVGLAYKYVLIEECINTGNVTSSALNIGGFVGQLAAGSSADIKKSNNEGAITGTGTGDRNIGGFIGFAKGATPITIDGCINKGAVSASDGSNTGGFVGKFDNTTGTLTIKNSNNEGTVTSKVSVAGGFIGFQWGIANIDNCKNKAAINANSISVGGFVAHNPTGNVTITNSANEHAFNTTAQYTGGFVGWGQQYLTIKNSTNSGAITSTKSEAGGFVGILHNGALIENCVNTGIISSNSNYVAGFIANHKSGATTINNCRNTGNVSTTGAFAGGFVGSSTDSLIMNNCLNTGNVTSTQQMGGLVGRFIKDANANLTLTMEKCSNAGVVTGNAGNVGGVVGFVQNTTKAEFKECQNIGNVVNSGTATNFGGFIGWSTGANVILSDCLNGGTIQSSANNVAGFIGTAEGSTTVQINRCLNLGTITNTAQYGQRGAFIGNAKCAVTKTNSYARKESCSCVMFINYNGTVKWETDNTIQIPEANLKADAAKTNAPNLDWSKWVTSTEYPKLKCFEQVSTQ